MWYGSQFSSIIHQNLYISLTNFYEKDIVPTVHYIKYEIYTRNAWSSVFLFFAPVYNSILFLNTIPAIILRENCINLKMNGYVGRGWPKKRWTAWKMSCVRKVWKGKRRLIGKDERGWHIAPTTNNVSRVGWWWWLHHDNSLE